MNREALALFLRPTRHAKLRRTRLQRRTWRGTRPQSGTTGRTTASAGTAVMAVMSRSQSSGTAPSATDTHARTAGRTATPGGGGQDFGRGAHDSVASEAGLGSETRDGDLGHGRSRGRANSVVGEARDGGGSDVEPRTGRTGMHATESGAGRDVAAESDAAENGEAEGEAESGFGHGAENGSDGQSRDGDAGQNREQRDRDAPVGKEDDAVRPLSARTVKPRKLAMARSRGAPISVPEGGAERLTPARTVKPRGARRRGWQSRDGCYDEGFGRADGDASRGAGGIGQGSFLATSLGCRTAARETRSPPRE